MNEHSQAMVRDARSLPERWLWRLVTAGLVGLAASLVAIGLVLYV
jgi:hypothetical protein